MAPQKVSLRLPPTTSKIEQSAKPRQREPELVQDGLRPSREKGNENVIRMREKGTELTFEIIICHSMNEPCACIAGLLSAGPAQRTRDSQVHSIERVGRRRLQLRTKRKMGKWIVG